MPVDRLRLAGLLSLCLLGACGRSAPQHAPEPTSASAPPLSVPELPVAEPPLAREALLIDMVRAASAFASGAEDGDLQKSLEGKRFVLRSRFGCPTDPAEGGQGSVKFDPEKRILRIRLNPYVLGSGPVVGHFGGDKVEAVEGFAIDRWWMLAAACPRPPMPASTEPAAVANGAPPAMALPAPSGTPVARGGPTAPPRSMLIAQFFTTEDPRTRRRDGRAYEATVQLAEGAVPSVAGYDLVIAGRLRAIPDGPVIACRSSGADAPPSCVLSAIFDRVAIEDPTTGKTLAEWTNS